MRQLVPVLGLPKVHLPPKQIFRKDGVDHSVEQIHSVGIIGAYSDTPRHRAPSTTRPRGMCFSRYRRSRTRVVLPVPRRPMITIGRVVVVIAEPEPAMRSRVAGTTTLLRLRPQRHVALFHYFIQK